MAARVHWRPLVAARAIGCSVIALCLFAVAARPAHADRAPVPLGKLIADADAIVLATLTSMTPGQVPGSFMAAFGVNEVLSGPSTLTQFAVTGNAADEDALPPLAVGTRVLALLDVVGQGPMYVPVGGEGGIFPLTAAAVPAARALVATAIANGNTLLPADAAPYLMATTPAANLPAGLAGALIEEISSQVTAADEPMLEAIACSQAKMFRRDARLWAVGVLGRLYLTKHSGCLTGLAQDVTRRDEAIAAVDALGNMGDPQVIAPLTALLRSAQADPRVSKGTLKRDAFAPGAPAADPEDQRNPSPDPGETQTTGPGSDGPSAGQGTPTTDSDPEPPERGRDPQHRRGDGGLTHTILLTLGKLDRVARGTVPGVERTLRGIAIRGDDLALHSTAVHALGLINSPAARSALKGIARKHPNPLLRMQAQQTAARPPEGEPQ